MSQNLIVRACELCGAIQPRDESRSNENWNVYDAKAICRCGGKYKIMAREEAEKLRNES